MVDRLVEWSCPRSALRWRRLDRYLPELEPGFAWYCNPEMRRVTEAEARERPGLVLTPTGHVDYTIGVYPPPFPPGMAERARR